MDSTHRTQTQLPYDEAIERVTATETRVYVL